MSTSNTRQSVSRRTALAGLGAGGLGLALAATARPASAQDAAAEMAHHPLVGLWQNWVGDEPMPWTFSIYHADGTYLEWNSLNVGAALGIWRPTGERTAESLYIYRDTDPTTVTETPGTATFRMTIEVDETGNAMTTAGGLDLRAPDGSPIATIPGAGAVTATRVTFDHNPATGSTAATPTAATPTT
jgi:hypothetical protein